MCLERGCQGVGNAGQRRNFLQVEKGGGGLWLRGERAGAGGGTRAVAQPTRELAVLSSGARAAPRWGGGDRDSPVCLGGAEGSPVKSAPVSAWLCASARLSICPSIRPLIYLSTRLFLAATAAF